MAILQNTTVSGSLVVTGDLTARQFILSSSVTFFTESFASGSTRFGDSADDNMIMTGSFKVSGSTGGGFIITGSTGFVGIGTSSPNSILEIQKDTNGDTPITFINGSGGSGNTSASISLNFTLRNGSGGSSGGVILKVGKETDHIGANVNDYFAISTTKSDAMGERMRITSGGNVGIGISGPLAKLHVETSTATDGIYLSRSTSNKQTILLSADDGVGAYIAGNTTPAGNASQTDGAGRLILQGGSTEGFQFQTSYVTGGTAASWTTRMRITNDGYLRLAGSGIQFNGDTAAANSLNDYEEGLIAATVTCSTSGTVTLDGGYNSLAYVKVGSIVHVTGLLYVNSVSSPVGTFSVPLPFAVANLSDAAGTAAANVHIDNAVSANSSAFCAIVNETESSLRVYLGNTTTLSGDSAQQLKSTSSIYISVTYRTS